MDETQFQNGPGNLASGWKKRRYMIRQVKYVTHYKVESELNEHPKR